MNYDKNYGLTCQAALAWCHFLDITAGTCQAVLSHIKKISAKYPD